MIYNYFIGDSTFQLLNTFLLSSAALSYKMSYHLVMLTCVSCSVVPNSLRLHGLQPTRLLCLWDFPGKDTGVFCHFLLQGIFPSQGSNLGLLHCRQIIYQLSYQGSPSSTRKQPNMSSDPEKIYFHFLQVKSSPSQ